MPVLNKKTIFRGRRVKYRPGHEGQAVYNKFRLLPVNTGDFLKRGAIRVRANPFPVVNCCGQPQGIEPGWHSQITPDNLCQGMTYQNNKNRTGKVQGIGGEVTDAIINSADLSQRMPGYQCG